jgi:chemotaxis protein methyltransferase CheR
LRGLEQFGLSAFSDSEQVASALERVREQGDVLEALTEELVVPETHFFREREQLAHVRDALLPELVRTRPSGHRVRAWSAGCASGEEAYSLAILFDGVFEAARIVGTDLSPRLIARAKAASYRPWSFRGVSPDLIARYFVENGDLRYPIPRIRRAVDFHPLNLLADEGAYRALGLDDFDLILLRNVLVHLDRRFHPVIAERIHRALRPGGILLSAAADPHLDDLAPFEVIAGPSGVLYRKPTSGPSARCSSSAFQPARRSVVGPELPAEISIDVDAIRALADRGRAKEALGACEKALADHPLHVELRLLRATVLLELKRRKEARRALIQVLCLDPNQPIARRLLDAVELDPGEHTGEGER